MSDSWTLLAFGFLTGASAAAAAAYRLHQRQRRRYGRLLSFVSHEINTPLTSVNMTVLNFNQGVFGPLSKEHEEWMRFLAEQTLRLNYLVGDLRDFIHLQFHQDLRLYPEPVDAGGVMQETLERMKNSIARNGTSVALEVSAGLPKVWMDLGRLSRVLADLLAHARKFNTTGPISISVRPAGESGKVQVDFAYQGPALTRHEAAMMLDLFYPVGRSKSTILPCVGLGLGICRAILERGGGELFFDVDGDGRNRLRALLPVAKDR